MINTECHWADSHGFEKVEVKLPAIADTGPFIIIFLVDLYLDGSHFFYFLFVYAFRSEKRCF